MEAKGDLAARRPIFGIAYRDTSMLYALRPTHGGSAMGSADWFFNFIVVAIGIISSVLIAMAMM
jgi:hypothetical protein